MPAEGQSDKLERSLVAMHAQHPWSGMHPPPQPPVMPQTNATTNTGWMDSISQEQGDTSSNAPQDATAPAAATSQPQEFVLHSFCSRSALLLCSFCVHSALILHSSALIQCSCGGHSAFILHSFCARVALIRRSFCTHSALVLRSFGARSKFIRHSFGARSAFVQCCF